MQIKIDTNFQQVRRHFAHMAKQVDFAGAVALTKTGKDVQAAVPAQAERDLDRPTDFTKRGTYLRAARKDSLVAEVGFKDRQARYMALQIAGGVYKPGAAGIRLPGNITLNAFGNIPRGLVGKLKAAAKDGTLGTAVAKRIGAGGKGRRKGAAEVQLFYGQPTGDRWKNAPVGIWRRIPPSTPGGEGKLVPVIVFERKAVTYKRRFDFIDLAQRTANQRFGPHFETAFINAMRTAR